MKKQLFASCAIAITSLFFSSHAVHAQDNKDNDKHEMSFKLKFGIKGGLNVSNMTINNNGDVQDKRAIASYNIGVYADVALLPVFSIQPGLTLNGKGSKFTLGDDGSDNYARVATRPVYLELPVNALIKLPLIHKVKLFFGAGPYLAMAVGGKNQVDGKLLGVSYSEDTDITYGSDNLNGNNGNSYEGNLKRFDAGFNIIGGIEISHFTLNANYGYGVVNVKPGSTNGGDNKYQNRVVSVQVGFIL